MKPASLMNVSVVVESPNVMYRGDVTMPGGRVALCGDWVEMRPASVMDVDSVFMHATQDLMIRGDILGASSVRLISDNTATLRPRNTIGGTYGPKEHDPLFLDPVVNVDIDVTGHFDMFGEIYATGNVDITTNSFKLFPQHFFDVDGACQVTGLQSQNSRPLYGTCSPGVNP